MGASTEFEPTSTGLDANLAGVLCYLLGFISGVAFLVLERQNGFVRFHAMQSTLTFLGLFGIHRFYMGKWFTGVIYLFTGGLFLVGYVYDYWTLNTQVSEINRASGRAVSA